MTITPRAALAHPADHRAGAQERAGRVDVEVRSPALERRARERRALGRSPALLTSTSTGPVRLEERRDRRPRRSRRTSARPERDAPARRAPRSARRSPRRSRRVPPSRRRPGSRDTLGRHAPAGSSIGTGRSGGPARAGSRALAVGGGRARGTAATRPRTLVAAACSVQCGSWMRAGERAGRAAGQHDRVHVVAARDRADRDRRDPGLVADPVGERRLEAAPVGRLRRARPGRSRRRRCRSRPGADERRDGVVVRPSSTSRADRTAVATPRAGGEAASGSGSPKRVASVRTFVSGERNEPSR